jgi:hypothetical protein
VAPKEEEKKDPVCTKELRGLKADIKDWQKACYGFNFESERKGPAWLDLLHPRPEGDPGSV